MDYLVVILAVVGLLLGCGVGYFITIFVLKSRVAEKIKEAEEQGENLKKSKLLEAKEKFLNMKSEFEKEVQARNSKIQQIENRAQQSESRAQQKEQQLNQKQKELDRKNNELDTVRANLEKQLSEVDVKKSELDRKQAEVTEKLAEVAGLSAQQAKEQLVESIKDEAKTEAMAYVTEIMEEASKGDITVSMSMYSDNEQVGSLGKSYTRNDKQTTTHNGDIVLYSGSNIVLFYGSNSWSYTRLGKMDLSEAEVTELLSNGDVSVRLTSTRN